MWSEEEEAGVWWWSGGGDRRVRGGPGKAKQNAHFLIFGTEYTQVVYVSDFIGFQHHNGRRCRAGEKHLKIPPFSTGATRVFGIFGLTWPTL